DVASIGRIEDWARKLAPDLDVRLSVSQFQSPGSLTQALVQLEDRWLKAQESVEKRQQEEERERLLERQSLQGKATAHTIVELASISKPAESAPLSEGNVLLRAVRAAGEAQGISIRSPANFDSRADPLQNILRASGVRSRAVMLEGEWWTS